MQQKRLAYFDMAKGFGIILVVLGHIEYVSEPLRAWISSFHMPLFFVISGMLINFKEEQKADISMLLKKKWKSILVPYLWFCLLYFFVDIFNIVMGKIDLHTFIVDCIQSLSFYGMSVLWFLPALFLAEIGFLIIKKTLPDYIVVPLIIALSFLAYLGQLSISNVYTLHEDSLLITSCINFIRVFLRAAVAMFFVMAAFYLFNLIKNHTTFNIIELIIGIILFIVCIFASQINGCVDLRNIILKNYPVYLVIALLGSMAVILIFKNCPRLDPLIFYGKNSLIVMATHINTYILYAAILIAWRIDAHISHAKYYIFIFNIMIFTFLFEAVTILIINRFLPFMVGKPYPKKSGRE